jgi:hypothetical protein
MDKEQRKALVGRVMGTHAHEMTSMVQQLMCGYDAEAGRRCGLEVRERGIVWGRQLQEGVGCRAVVCCGLGGWQLSGTHRGWSAWQSCGRGCWLRRCLQLSSSFYN